MKEIKYTTDGKKVVVIGDLNQTEKIVQEIFVTENGDEIPTGERFVVKSLLDAPAKSWKEKELESLEANYKTEKEGWEKRLSALYREKSLAYDSLNARVKWLRGVAKEPHCEKFKQAISTLVEFFTNSDKWIFYSDYSDWHLVKFNEDGTNELFDNISHDYRTPEFKSMRLLSLYGLSDGNFEYKISLYGDGSGSENTVEFFKSERDALNHIQNKFNALNKYEYYHLGIAEKFDLKLDDEKMKAYNNSRIKAIENDIANYKKNLAIKEDELLKYKQPWTNQS